jgi:Mn-containing catalase
MFVHDKRLAYTVRVDKPNPLFAKYLQQAIGGVEGEMRVMNQYLFQAWGSRGPKKYRDMLLNTGTEEIGHIEMLATAVALNLEGAPAATVEEAAQDPLIEAVLGGTMPRQLLSTGLAALPVDANGVPFTGAYVVATGNLAADMTANVAAEGGGRVLATRLWELTDDPGMKDMLAFLIARDTMHQNQWLAVLEELEDQGLPAPWDFPQKQENQEFSYVFLQHSNATVPDDARWTSGPSIDGNGEFTLQKAKPLGKEPQLAPPPPQAHSMVSEKGLGAKMKNTADRAKRKVKA